MTRTRRILVLLLVVLQIAGIGGTGFARGAVVYAPLIAAATPNTAGAGASYHITFNTSQYTHVTELAIRFSYDTTYLSEAVMASSVVVNGLQVMSARFSKIANNDIELYVYLNQALGPATAITVDIAASAGLINPSYTRSCYRMRVGLLSNHFEYGELISDLYSIVPSTLSNLTLAVEPPIVGSLADYAVSFVTGVNGTLKTGQDNVTISFPAGTTVPTSILAGLVTVNGIACNGQVFQESSVRNGLRIYMPITIAASSPVTVFFPAAFGLRNPGQTGPVTVSVSTSREPTVLDSAAVVVRGREVSNLAIGLGSPSAGTATAMQLSFVTSPVGRLSAGQRIYMVPAQAAYALPLGGDGLGVTVNGSSTLVVHDGNALSIRVPVTIGDNAPVTVAMPVAVGWLNPASPGTYEFGVYTESDTSMNRCTVTVTPPSVSSVQLGAASHGIAKPTQLTISCVLSPTGSLAAGDETRVSFDQGFTVPASIDPSTVLVEGVPASRIVIAGQTVTAVLSAPIVGGSTLHVEFLEAAGIRAPAAPGTYGAAIATSRDSVEARSNSIEFRALVNVTFVISPLVPNGSQGYYVGTSPIVSIVADGAKTVHVRIDGANAVAWDGRPISIPSGKHTVEAWAIDVQGAEGDHATQSFLVDLVRPTIIVDQGAGDVLAHASPFTLSGTVSEPVDVLQVNGVTAAVGTDLRWTVSVAAADGQSLSIYARDLAGNGIASVRTVHVDATPPVVQLVTPATLSSTTSEETQTVSFRMSEAGTATVNGISVLATKGLWSVPVDLVPGPNVVTIAAMDLAGNESTVTLTIEQRQQTVILLAIGSASATVDTQTLDMGTQPVLLKSGTVMVPLRFVSEALGAAVEWLPAMRIVAVKRGDTSIQLQIGSKTALVDLGSMPLLEAPIIVGGRTLVPLRFVSEAFGANVSWDQQLKRVTITLLRDSSAR
ncbi:MAG: stalk domain-containing protein [Candidatus Cryosericum sp.]